MASTTLIRVKRRRSQSPAEALLVHLAAKRPRGEVDQAQGAAALTPESGPKTKIFRFATTLTDPEKAGNDQVLRELVGNKVSEQKLETPIKKSSRTPIKVRLTSINIVVARSLV